MAEIRYSSTERKKKRAHVKLFYQRYAILTYSAEASRDKEARVEILKEICRSAQTRELRQRPAINCDLPSH